MGTNRFLGLLDWLLGRQKHIQARKPIVRKKRTAKYLVTFEVQENMHGNFEKTSVIIKTDIEKFLQTMQSENHKFNIIFMIKL